MSDIIEKTRIIDGYMNYSITNVGNVFNNKTQRKLKPQSDEAGYLKVTLCNKGKIKILYVHRLVACAFLKKVDGKNVVDHIDGNKRNNDVGNLRFVTTSENSMNSKKRCGTSSLYKGVALNKRADKWTAQIYHNMKKIHLGSFDDEKEAGEAYNKKAIELFGEYAKLNVIK